MKLKKSICFLGLIALMASLAPFAEAIPVYDTSALGELTGSRSEGAGVVTGGNWASPPDLETETISWEVTDLGGGLWEYEYTFTNFNRPAISHVILDLTDDCVDPGDPGCVTDATGDLDFGTFGPAPSNPGFPVGASITGVKFDFGGLSPFTISFISNRPPVYGDFYTKGGVDSFAYNAGLANHASESIGDFIVRPNSSIGVPEPGTLLLLGSGLIGLAAMRRRWKK